MQLVINSPGTFITQKDECFRVKHRDRVFDVSPLKIESIVISSQAMISTRAVVQALQHNIDIIFLDSFGYPLGRVWFSKPGSTVRIRRRQLVAAENSLGLEIAVQMISRKLENQLRFLKKLMHARPGKESKFVDALTRIEDSRAKLAQHHAASLDEERNRIMGLEGAAGRACFRCLAELMPEKYHFHVAIRPQELLPGNYHK